MIPPLDTPRSLDLTRSVLDNSVEPNSGAFVRDAISGSMNKNYRGSRDDQITANRGHGATAARTIPDVYLELTFLIKPFHQLWPAIIKTTCSLQAISDRFSTHEFLVYLLTDVTKIRFEVYIRLIFLERKWKSIVHTKESKIFVTQQNPRECSEMYLLTWWKCHNDKNNAMRRKEMFTERLATHPVARLGWHDF